MVHCQVGQNFAVQGDTFGVDFTHEFGVGHSVGTDSSVDTLDPEAAEIAFFVFTVAVGVGQTFFYRVFWLRSIRSSANRSYLWRA